LFINYHLIIILLKQSPAAHQVHLPAERRASTHSVQLAEWAAGQLSRLYHKGPVASKFVECKPNRLLHAWSNVEGLLEA